MPGFSKPRTAAASQQDNVTAAPSSSQQRAVKAGLRQAHPQPLCSRWVFPSCIPRLGGKQKWHPAKAAHTRVRVSIQRSNGVFAEVSSSIDSVAFLFCSSDAAKAESAKAEEDAKRNRSSLGTVAPLLQPLKLFMDLPPFNLQNLASSLLPAFLAVSQQGLSSPGVAVACLPIMAPFQVPMVPPELWMENKRARAFHRCCFIAVYAQGVFAVMKFARGNLVGGFYDAVQALMGAYAISPQGLSFMPNYLTISGFNGVLGIFKVFQVYNGVPLHSIPMMAILPPAIGVSSAYWGWQFCREVRAVAIGIPHFGPQDTCFVKMMGADWCCLPSSFSAVSDQRPESNDDADGADRAQGYTSFGGDAHRLVECDKD